MRRRHLLTLARAPPIRVVAVRGAAAWIAAAMMHGAQVARRYIAGTVFSSITVKYLIVELRE